MSILLCSILEFPDTMNQWYLIRIWLSISGNSSDNCMAGMLWACPNVVTILEWPHELRYWCLIESKMGDGSINVFGLALTRRRRERCVYQDIEVYWVDIWLSYIAPNWNIFFLCRGITEFNDWKKLCFWSILYFVWGRVKHVQTTCTCHWSVWWSSP